MNIRTLTLSPLLMVLVACAGVAPRSYDDDHPASPSADEAPVAGRSKAFDPSSKRQIDMQPMLPGSTMPDGEGGEQSPYTCVMHPEVIQDSPGSCPICNMKLVKKSEMDSTKVGHHAH